MIHSNFTHASMPKNTSLISFKMCWYSPNSFKSSENLRVLTEISKLNVLRYFPDPYSNIKLFTSEKEISLSAKRTFS